MTQVVDIREAKTQFAQLVARVEAGEDVVIVRRGEPVARMAACRPRGRRQPDALKGRIIIPSYLFEPLPEEELAAWEGR